MDFTISAETFATWPVGIAIVWAIMAVIDKAYPVMVTRIKVLLQLGISVFYSAVAALLFMEGTQKEIGQKAIILFLMVAFSQTALFENFMKLTGKKGITEKAFVPFHDYGDQGGGNGGRI